MQPERARNASGLVPIFGRWRNAYLAVVAIFVLEVAFFYFVSRWFL